MKKPSRLFRLLLAAALAAPLQARAAPRLPSSDGEVLERLPARSADPATQATRELRQRLSIKPGDAATAAELAQTYYRLAQRDGDPRYVGYAQAVLAPWPAPGDAPDEVLLARSQLSQFVHDFAGAERDLAMVLARAPGNSAALSYRAVIYMVQARYEDARRDCRMLAERASGLIVSACEPTLRALVGEAGAAYASLARALAAAPNAPLNERYWVLTRLAEIAHRLDRTADAEAHFRAALALGVNDQYLLATYAEFLLDNGRAAEAVELLRDQTRNDVLLLRLILAEQASQAPALAEHVATMAARIDAARRRGDELHLADEAIFELRFRQQPATALKLARRNWDSGQREPGDARILLEASLAARDRTTADPALAWLAATRHEDKRLRELGRRVEALPR